MVRGNVFGAEALAEREGDALNKFARVDEDQCRFVVFRMRSKLVKYLLPHGVRGDRCEFIAGNFDGDVHDAALAELNHISGRTVGVNTGEEFGDEFDRILRGGQTDSLRRRIAASNE